MKWRTKKPADDTPEPQQCGNCKFNWGGECHRFPPFVTTVFGGSTFGNSFPGVKPKWWCAEWAEKGTP